MRPDVTHLGHGRSVSFGWTWTKSNPEQAPVIQICPIAQQRPPYGQDSSIIAQVEVAPPPPEAIASDQRATAGCAPTQFWRFVLTKPQQLPSSHRSHPNKRRGKHPSYGLFSRIHEDRAGSSGFVGNSHEPEVHAGYRDPSPRWLSSDDPRKPIRKSATPSTGRPRLARSRRRGQCQPIGVSILPALPTGRAVAL
jgi:hypothetical protein